MCPFSLEQPSTICAFSHLGCPLQKTSQNIPFRLSLPPVDTGVPNGLLMLRNSLNDLVFELRCGVLRHWAWLCRWYWRYRNLIDWLIDSKCYTCIKEEFSCLRDFFGWKNLWGIRSIWSDLTKHFLQTDTNFLLTVHSCHISSLPLTFSFDQSWK